MIIPLLSHCYPINDPGHDYPINYPIIIPLTIQLFSH